MDGENTARITRESIRNRIQQRLQGGPRETSGTDSGVETKRRGRQREIRGVEIEVRGVTRKGVGADRAQDGSESAETFYGPGNTQSESDGQEPESGRQSADSTNATNGRKRNQPSASQQPKRGRKSAKGFVEQLADGNKDREETRQSLVVNPEDCEDIKLIIQGVASGFAGYTGYDDFNYTDPQAYSVAMPAARILARYGMDEKVRKMSDPFLLLLALGATAGPKIAGYKAFLQWKAQAEAEAKNQIAQEAYNRAAAAANHPSVVVTPPPSGSPINQPVQNFSTEEQSPGTIGVEAPQVSSTVVNLQRRIASNE